MKYILLSFLLVSSLFALSEEDRVQIEQVIQDYTVAWNEKGGRGFGSGFAEDADFVNIFGMNFSGKEQIEMRHVKILETFLKGTNLEIAKVELREALPNTVIALVHWNLLGVKKPELSKGLFTQVFIKRENRWEITACQNTVVRPQP